MLTLSFLFPKLISLGRHFLGGGGAAANDSYRIFYNFVLRNIFIWYSYFICILYFNFPHVTAVQITSLHAYFVVIDKKNLWNCFETGLLILLDAEWHMALNLNIMFIFYTYAISVDQVLASKVSSLKIKINFCERMCRLPQSK